MVKDPSELTALSYNVDGVGKLFSDSKTRHTWTMDIDGETHVVVVTASWNSGKFVVELNGYERFHQITGGPFLYSFKFRDRLFKLFSMGERLSLEIDGVGFESYTSRAKANQAAMLQTYSRKAKTTGMDRPARDVDDSSDSDEAGKKGYVPFSGNLAERLGKRTPGYEIGSNHSDDEENEEDFFAVPNVEVKSFVTPQISAAPMIFTKDVSELTVIPPDLIELSSRASPVVNQAVTDDDQHVVTPRDKISPDELANPFAAFDELLLPPKSDKSNPFKQDVSS